MTLDLFCYASSQTGIYSAFTSFKIAESLRKRKIKIPNMASEKGIAKLLHQGGYDFLLQ